MTGMIEMWKERNVGKIRYLLGVLSCVLLVFMLGACGSKLPAAPDTYDLAGESIPSLNKVLGKENSGTLTDLETPETATADASAASSSSPSAECLYTYDKLDSGGDAASKYAESLTAQSEGFQVVDQSAVAADAPDYTAQSGDVILAKAAAQQGKILQLHISWTETSCQITLSRPDGEIKAAAAEPMTNDDAVDYIEGLKPATLGLPGSSMRVYRIYPIEGMVMVDGVPCLKLQAYQMNQKSKANEIVGVYLLSGDKSHLYQLQDGHVRELDVL